MLLSGLQGRIIRQRGIYRYILPHPLLRPYIAHYTLTLPGCSGMPQRLTLLPDASGCFVFRLGAWRTDSCYWGPTTHTVVVENNLEEIPYFFVEFLPCGAFVLTGLPQEELSDRRYTLEAVDRAARQTMDSLLSGCRDWGAVIDQADSFFLKRLEERRLSQAQRRFCMLIGERIDTAGEIAGKLGYSARHTGRIARPALGMGLKAYEQLCRFNRAASALKTSEKALALLCQDAGYYDQPHFIHDFKLVTGKTPTEYLKNLSGFYNEELKFSAIL